MFEWFPAFQMHEFLGLLDPWNWRHCICLKCQKPLAWHSVTS